MPDKILVVDDEICLLETLTYNLQRQGYIVFAVGDGKNAIQVARQHRPDLIILDIMLPDIDGFEVCQVLRKEMNAPIIFISALDDEYQRVIALEIGGDDFLSKPFSMRELIARVKAQFRLIHLMRGDGEIPQETSRPSQEISAGNINIHIPHRDVTIDGKPANLKPKEFDLLVYFIKNQGKVLSRELIMKNVWDGNRSSSNRTIDVHVRWLREKIENCPTRPLRIVTIHGVGYRFEV